MKNSCLITRVVLRNYKSIAACDIRLGKLSFLVGPNGSGKSNFLDALHFLTDALRDSLDHAIRGRGGINEVRRRSSGHPNHFSARIEFSLSDQITGHYAFLIGAKSRGAFHVQQEECFIRDKEGSSYYRVEAGEVVKATFTPAPPVVADRLYLVNAAGLPPFRRLYDAFSRMGFYNLNPEQIRELQSPDPGELLTRDGSNLSSVLSNLQTKLPKVKDRIEEYLSRVTPGVTGVDTRLIGPKETLEFRQEVAGAKHPWRFLAVNMSDGTLRALGVLVALFHTAVNASDQRRLVGIEEPEVALHPAATGILIDSLEEASEHTQILVTSHSPDLLDNRSILDDAIIAVVSEYGETKIGRLDEAGRTALRDHLYTAGELLRLDQLRPDPLETDLKAEQIELFGPGI